MLTSPDIFIKISLAKAAIYNNFAVTAVLPNLMLQRLLTDKFTTRSLEIEFL
jgi:hypothetical protein